MEGIATFLVIMVVCFGIIILSGYIYAFDVVANMEPTGGNPYLKVETNLQPST